MALLGTEDSVLSTYIAEHHLDTIMTAPTASTTTENDQFPCDQCAPYVTALEKQLQTAAELGQVLLTRHSVQAAAAQHAERRLADAETALKGMELARARAENDRETAERAQKMALGRIRRLEREMELMVAQYERLERTAETTDDQESHHNLTNRPVNVPPLTQINLVDRLNRDNSNLQATVINLREELLTARDEINALRTERDAISRSKEIHHHHHHIHLNSSNSSEVLNGALPEDRQFYLNKPQHALRKFVSQESGLNATTTIFEQDEDEMSKQVKSRVPDYTIPVNIESDSNEDDEDDIPYSPFPVLKRSISHDSIFSTLTTNNVNINTQSAGYPVSMYMPVRPAITNRQTSAATVSTTGRDVSAELTRSNGLSRQKSLMILHQHHYKTTTNGISSSSSISNGSSEKRAPKRSISIGSKWSTMLFGSKPSTAKESSKTETIPPLLATDSLAPVTVTSLCRSSIPVASPALIYPQTTFSSPSTALVHSLSSQSLQKHTRN